MGGRVGLGSLMCLAFSLTGCGDSLTEYRNEEGRFRIRLPAEPSTEADPLLPAGVKSVRAVQRSGSITVAWEDLGRKDGRTADQRLEAACDQAAKSIRGAEVSRKAITLGGKHPGRELLVRTADEKTVVLDRMYLADGRLYQVVAQGQPWWVESAAVRKALDSFGLIEE